MTTIFLIGYMGSGKTTIGKLLADKMGYDFVDMDKLIEQKLFKSVSQIFAEQGEDAFRILEQECLHEVAEFNNTIISTGGGVPCFFDNMEFMNSHGLTIYLKLTPKELANRLENSRANIRPLLAERKGDELIQYISDGLAAREPFYDQAAFIAYGTIEEVVTKIYDFVSQH